MRSARVIATVLFTIALLVALASCSLFTRLDGFDSATNTESGAVDAGTDADPSTPTDAASEPGPPKPRAWRQVNVTGPPARHSPRMVFDEARGRAVLFGGGNQADAALDETWEWDGAAWSAPMLSTKPAGRRAPGLAYDRARSVVFVYGGAGALGIEPWEWDGGPAWRSSGTTSSSPGLGNNAMLAYDVDRKVIVVFGGHISDSTPSNTYVDQTWEWSSSGGFTKKTPGVSPSGRRGHVMVYDEARKRTIVYGGRGVNGLLGDLWEWDGATWTQRTPALSPPPRFAPCATYDSARRVMVVFGGRLDLDGAKSNADTWEWDGDTWKAGPAGPSARRSCAMTFDSKRNAVVMYGGAPRRTTFSESLGDTWIYE